MLLDFDHMCYTWEQPWIMMIMRGSSMTLRSLGILLMAHIRLHTIRGELSPADTQSLWIQSMIFCSKIRFLTTVGQDLSLQNTIDFSQIAMFIQKFLQCNQAKYNIHHQLIHKFNTNPTSYRHIYYETMTSKAHFLLVTIHVELVSLSIVVVYALGYWWSIIVKVKPCRCTIYHWPAIISYVMA